MNKLVYLGKKHYSFVTKMAQSMVANTQRAQRVQQNTLNEIYAIQHEAKLRNKVNIQSNVASLQKQLREQISKSLKRSEDKAKQSYQKSKRGLLSEKQIEQHNKMVQHCEKVRWEFMVQRQCCGFTIRNYQLVTSIYVIPPRIN